jgi:isopentenyl-diphosphate delta-isomerase
VETFETFDEDGNLLGLVPRDEVHRNGLWHRSAQVFVFNSLGELLLQLRAADKDLYASLWDYSVGEHLQPGESFVTGAVRGLDEELGVLDARLIQLGGVRKIEQVGDTYVDREIQQAFVCLYDGSIQFDLVEVAKVDWVSKRVLLQRLRDEPDVFTPWFVQDVTELGLGDRWDAILELSQSAVAPGVDC